MVYEPPSDLFVPVFYVFCTSKRQEVYVSILNSVMGALDDKLEPESVVCDFGSALIDAIQIQVSNARIIGCYFHFCKRAAAVWSVKLHIPEQEIAIAMNKNILYMPTVIPNTKVAGSGINDVRERIESKRIALTKALSIRLQMGKVLAVLP